MEEDKLNYLHSELTELDKNLMANELEFIEIENGAIEDFKRTLGEKSGEMSRDVSSKA